MEAIDKYIIPMIDNAFKVIEYMYKNHGEVGVSQISQDLDIPKATVYRILFTVSKWGFIEKTSISDKYLLGKSFIKVGTKVSSENDITVISTPYINDLAKEVGESVNLGIPYEDIVLTIYNAKGEDFYLVSKLIPVSPLNCSAMGKLYLSKYSDKELKDYFSSNKPQKRTINSTMNLDEYLKIKEEINTEGISFDREEYEYGLTCIAAPIRNEKANIIATISISGPTTRLQYKGIDFLKKNLIETAKKIEESYNFIF